MKKTFRFLMVIALAALTLTGCDDVPMPYNQPDITPDEPTVEPTDGYLAESFASTFGDFTLTKVKGTPWVIDSYGYAKATGYDNASASTTESESYIVSKAIDLTNAKKPGLKFSYVLRYVTRDGVAVNGVKNQVLITDNYTGNPTTTNWTDITGSLTEGTDWKTWFTYTADLSAYKGKKNIVIALYYACTTSSATWEVKDLSVKEDNIDNTGDNDGNTGDTSTANGDFETWVDNIPNNWKTASTAGNATLSQSTDAHSGKYSVKVGGAASANKRIGYKELELKAGSYKVTFYAKAATAEGGSVRPGYVPVNDGTADSQGYKYGSYVNGLSNTEWTFVDQTLEIPTDGTYSFVIMNSKNPGKDVLIDDVTITTGSTTIVK